MRKQKKNDDLKQATFFVGMLSFSSAALAATLIYVEI